MAESLGSLADKLSIAELKIWHMREQGARPDAAPEFRARCAEQVEILTMQRDDLAAEIAGFLADVAAGRVVPKVYRQLKMYNDPVYRTRA